VVRDHTKYWYVLGYTYIVGMLFESSYEGCLLSHHLWQLFPWVAGGWGKHWGPRTCKRGESWKPSSIFSHRFVSSMNHTVNWQEPILISAANWHSSTNLQFAYGRSESCFIGWVESFHNFGPELKL